MLSALSPPGRLVSHLNRNLASGATSRARPHHVKVLSSRPHWLDSNLLLGVAEYAHHFGDWQLTTPMSEPLWSVEPDEKPDGLIVRMHPESPVQGKTIRQLGFEGPIVSISTPDLSEGWATVYWNTVDVGREVATYFLDQGHRNFAAIGHIRYATAWQRMEGFRAVVERAGQATLMLEPPDTDQPEAWTAILETLRKPVAVLATSDHVARVLIQNAERQGWRVPDDLTVVGGSDDRLVCEMNRPRLSSIELPVRRVGFEAAALLARVMNGEPAPNEPLLIPPGGVVERETSHRTAADDPQVNQALQYIREHAHQPLSVGDVVQHVPLSRRALELRFKKAVGHTLQKEVWRVHVTRARTLLVDTDLPMPDVAERAGFHNAQRMYEVFKRETGTAPSDYRRARR